MIDECLLLANERHISAASSSEAYSNGVQATDRLVHFVSDLEVLTASLLRHDEKVAAFFTEEGLLRDVEQNLCVVSCRNRSSSCCDKLRDGSEDVTVREDLLVSFS